VLYGEPAAYGIVSNILSTKVGINVFLDGYLPNENVRFRDKKFTFDVSTSTDDFEKGEVVISYPELKRIYPAFSVSIDAGQVRRGEVLGIMGANALGKTTMMKMIAGVEKPDVGEIDRAVTISYKPQYLTNDIDVDVISVLDAANGGPIFGSVEEEQIVDPLKIKKLYNKSVKNLSGGELQKVAIVTCLLKKADVYALDEPSAFLDVEDRIAVAKFIQRFVRSYAKSAIVIDHDIQLMDLISDKMVIFEGVSGKAGHATSPLTKAEAMNMFLKSLDITFRRDEATRRPRVNKAESRLDKMQKDTGNFYYKI
jgi:ATP-binding cassette subfamily E protein 1